MISLSTPNFRSVFDEIVFCMQIGNPEELEATSKGVLAPK